MITGLFVGANRNEIDSVPFPHVSILDFVFQIGKNTPEGLEKVRVLQILIQKGG